MSDWESELYRTSELIGQCLKALRETGLTYISKSTLSGKKMTDCNNNIDGIEILKKMQAEVASCQRCRLCAERTNAVFGSGNSKASVVFVGEGPGAEEDKQGEPFVGRAGQLLTKMINAMGLRREDVYICNVVKCRPPNNRDPEPDEIEACQPFLKKQLQIIGPQIIVGLGRHACQTLLNTDRPMSKIRGNFHQYEGISFMPTYHPAYLLRNPAAKREVWEDLQQVMARLTNNAPR